MWTMPVAARFSRTLRAHIGCILAAAVLFPATHAAWAVSDLDLKVAYLFNFASLVSWPSSSLKSDSTITIGVVGDDGMADQLERRIGSRTAKGHPVEVRRLSWTDAAGMRSCHVLYVADGERGRVDAILRTVQGSPVLTVSDGKEFARYGGIIAFEVEDKTIRFTANTRSASNNGISLGSDVLRLAREVVSR